MVAQIRNNKLSGPLISSINIQSIYLKEIKYPKFNNMKYQHEDKTTKVKNVPTIFYKFVPFNSARTMFIKNTDSSPKNITSIMCSIEFKN